MYFVKQRHHGNVQHPPVADNGGREAILSF
jgi:hypothetical protein